jgi:transcriptional regulator with XRE-family HTH domain
MSVVSYYGQLYAVRMRQTSADTIYKELGKRIVASRKVQNISQEQLAAASDVDRSHIGFIEQGRRRPTISTLYKITQALGIRLEQLFKGL